MLLNAKDDRLELTATLDLDVTVSCGVEANVKKGGATTVPVKKLFGIVRELAGGEVEIEADSAKRTIAASEAAPRSIK